MSHALFDSSPASPGGLFRDVEPHALAPHLGSLHVVDVREPDEFVGELGHILGADLVPLGTVDGAAKAWDRAADVVVVCRSGKRSTEAARKLVALGFQRVMNLRGGMMGWDAAALPVVR